MIGGGGGQRFSQSSETGTDRKDPKQYDEHMVKACNSITDFPSDAYNWMRGTKMGIPSLTYMIIEDGYPIIQTCDAAQQKLIDVDYEISDPRIKDFDKLVHDFQINKQSPLMEGDEMYAIDGVKTEGLSYAEIHTKLTGYLRTFTKISVRRKGHGRGNIKLIVKVLRDHAITNSTGSQMIDTLQFLHTRLVALEEKHMLGLSSNNCQFK